MLWRFVKFGCTNSAVFPASSLAAAAAAVLAPLFATVASDPDPVAQSWRSLCTTGIQRVSCYYDAAERAIAGVVLESSTGSAQQLCRTTGSPAKVINVPNGMGIEAVTVASGSISRRVMMLEFRWVSLIMVSDALLPSLLCALCGSLNTCFA